MCAASSIGPRPLHRRTIEYYTRPLGRHVVRTKFEGLKVSMEPAQPAARPLPCGFGRHHHVGLAWHDQLWCDRLQSEWTNSSRTRSVRPMPSAPDSPLNQVTTAHPASSAVPCSWTRLSRKAADALVAKRTWRAEEDFYKAAITRVAPITPGVLLSRVRVPGRSLLLAGKIRPVRESPRACRCWPRWRNVRSAAPVYPGRQRSRST